MFRGLDDLDPTPDAYSTDDAMHTSRWLAAEARRIKRERRRALIDEIILGVFAGLAVALTFIIGGVFR